MIISKFYNRTAKPAPSSDPRVITPSSIPIFILPPTLEAFANSPKPELNDSCDCWSLADEDSTNNPLKTSTSAFLNSTSNFRLVDSSQSSKNLTASSSLTQKQKNASDPTSIFEINPKAVAKSRDAKNNNNNNGFSANTNGGNKSRDSSRNSQRLKKTPPVYSNSCEVTEDESIVNGGQGGGASSCKNGQTTSTKHMVKTMFRNGLLNMQAINAENDEVKSKENYCNLWVLHGGGGPDEAAANNNGNGNNIKSSNSNLALNRLSVNEPHKLNGAGAGGNKNHHSNGNIHLVHVDSGANSSTENMNMASSEITKSASMNLIKMNTNTVVVANTNIVEETTTTTSNLNNEERLQREYLRNLLKQLQQEQDQKSPPPAAPPTKSGNFLDAKLKKTKRSKSETLLTIENLWNSSFGGAAGANPNGGAANASDKSQEAYNSNKNLHARASIEHDNHHHHHHHLNEKQRMNFLEVGAGGNSMDANDSKRFSFRSLLKGNSPFIKQDSSATLRRDDSCAQKTTNATDEYAQDALAATRTNSDPKRRPLLDKLMAGGQSSYSISNSSSITNNSLSTLTTPTAAHSPFLTALAKNSNPTPGSSKAAAKLANPSELFEAAVRGATSETNVNKLFAVNSNNNNNNSRPMTDDPGTRATGLGADLAPAQDDTSNASFKRRQRYVKSNGSTNRVDATAAEDNDIERCFNDYYAQLGKAKLESAFSDKKKLESSLLNENDLSAFVHERQEHEHARSKSAKRRRTKSAKAAYRKFFTNIFKRKNSLNKQLPEIAAAVTNQKDHHRLDGCPEDGAAAPADQTNLNEFDFEIEDENGEIAKETIKLDLNYLNLNTIERELSRNASLAHAAAATTDRQSVFRASPRNSVRSFNTSVVSNSGPTGPIGNKSDSFDRLRRTNSLDANHGHDVININKSLSSSDKMPPSYACSVEVSFEKLQQTPKGHILSINVKNLRVKPLIEINHVKSKLTYLTIQLTNETTQVDTPGTPQASQTDHRQQPRKNKVMAKIFKNKTSKCKFEANSKNFQKPAEFILHPDHFMNVANEATIEIQKEINPAVASLIESEKTQGVVDGAGKDHSTTTRTSLFLFSIEIHSYLPISRKTLSSTFRKKKRIFKGQCQIHENFIRATQFTKMFALTEV